MARGRERQEETAKKRKQAATAQTRGNSEAQKMRCVNKYMIQIHSARQQVLAVTHRNHTAEEEPDLGELLQNEHKGIDMLPT